MVELFIDSPSRLGDNRHVMTYTIGAGKSFNMVLSHPDDSDGSGWNQNKEETLENMRREFQGWDPVYVLFTPRKTLINNSGIQVIKNHRNDRQDPEMASVQRISA